MDRKTIIAKLKEFEERFNLKSKDYHITHGAALVFLGLKQTTNDIDIMIEDKLIFDSFLAQIKFSQHVLQNGTILINVMEGVDIHHNYVNPSIPLLCSIEGGIRITTAEQILKDKLKLNRIKDQFYIDVLKKYLIIKRLWSEKGNKKYSTKFEYYKQLKQLNDMLGFEFKPTWK